MARLTSAEQEPLATITFTLKGEITLPRKFVESVDSGDYDMDNLIDVCKKLIAEKMDDFADFEIDINL